MISGDSYGCARFNFCSNFENDFREVLMTRSASLAASIFPFQRYTDLIPALTETQAANFSWTNTFASLKPVRRFGTVVRTTIAATT